MLQDPGRHYFNFTKKEKTGAIAVLAAVMFIFIAAKYIYPSIVKDRVIPPSQIAEAASLLKEKSSDSSFADQAHNYDDNSRYSYNQNKSSVNSFTGEMFYFDPNTLDEAGWQRLGIKEKTIATIKNYVNKGGKFWQPDDLNKIWGLRSDEKERLIPYVRIAQRENSKNNYTTNYTPYEKKPYEKKASVAIDINAGDSAAFDALPGIGPGYSRRIIQFRNRLGGFHSVEQIGETYGLPDSVFQKIKPLLTLSGENIRKININTASEDELKAHPYIRWQLAKLITEYRKQHGDFKNREDLKKIMLINDETYKKIFPYLSL